MLSRTPTPDDTRKPNAPRARTSNANHPARYSRVLREQRTVKPRAVRRSLRVASIEDATDDDNAQGATSRMLSRETALRE